MWLMFLKFPNGVQGPERVGKVEVVSVLGFACVLLPYSCSALHSYTRKRISFPACRAQRLRLIRGGGLRETKATHMAKVTPKVSVFRPSSGCILTRRVETLQ